LWFVSEEAKLASDARAQRLSGPRRCCCIRPPLEGEHAGYHRVISRTYAEWPLVEAVVRVVLVSKRFEFVRVTTGGIAPVPLRFIDVEEALRSSASEVASSH
jgi:CO/xanthine dehydrogenase FAD-binding subunit